MLGKWKIGYLVLLGFYFSTFVRDERLSRLEVGEVSECGEFGLRANTLLCAHYTGGNSKRDSHHRLCHHKLLDGGDPLSVLLQRLIHAPHNIHNCTHNADGFSLAVIHPFY